MTPREQLNHIDDGDFCLCPDCGGSGVIDEPRGCLASYRCDLCDGDGILFDPSAGEAVEEIQPMKKVA